jgi:hypothetical protein
MVIIPSCRNTAQLVNVLAGFQEKTVNEICVIIDDAGKAELNLVKKLHKKSLFLYTSYPRERKGIGRRHQRGHTICPRPRL